MSKYNGIVIWQYPVSPFSAKVRRVLHYKGLDFEVRDFSLSEMKATRKISPTGKLPVLDHDSQRIIDSTDIVRYLDREFPEKPILPDAPEHRAYAHIIEDWADESLYFYDLTMRGWKHNADLLAHDLIYKEGPLLSWLLKKSVPKFIKKTVIPQGIGRKSEEVVRREMTAHLQAIEAILTDHEWLAGNAISIADIAVISMLCVLERTAEVAATINDFPHIGCWRERVDALTLPVGTPPSERIWR